MSARSTFLNLNTAGTRVRQLPAELMHLICLWLSSEDLNPLALTSRAWWEVVGSYRWRNIDRIDQLVGLMQSSTDVHMNTGQSSDKNLGLNMNMVIGLAPTIPLSWPRVSQFVHTLVLYDRYQESPLFLPESHVRAIVDEETRGALLPNLHSLSLGELDWELGRGWHHKTWFHKQHSLDFLGLFLAPSVRRLALKCALGSLDIEKIYSRAPFITDLRLWLSNVDGHQPLVDHSNRNDQWLYSMLQGISTWECLSTLSISSEFLTRNTINLVGAIPSLRGLEILCKSHPDWQLLQIESNSFPALTNFFISQISPSDAIHLINQPILMSRLATLFIEFDREGPRSTIQQTVACLDCLPRWAPSLSQLIIHQSRLDEQMLRSLSMINLTSLDMRSVAIATDMAPLLLTLPPGLQYLDVSRLKAPVRLLERLAMRFQTLHFLAIGIWLNENIEGRGLNTPIECPIRLDYHLSRAREIDMTPADAKEYLGRIWLTVLMEDW